MSPARTGHDGVDLNKLVRRLVLDIGLLKYFSANGRSLAVISAISKARSDAVGEELRILDFLQVYVGGES